MVYGKTKDLRKRRLKTIHQIKELEDNDHNIYYNNILDQSYPNRPDDLENMCLYDFASYHDYHKIKCHDDCVMLKNQFRYMHIRKKFKLIKFVNIKPADNVSIVKYYHLLLILFKPWRN